MLRRYLVSIKIKPVHIFFSNCNILVLMCSTCISILDIHRGVSCTVPPAFATVPVASIWWHHEKMLISHYCGSVCSKLRRYQVCFRNCCRHELCVVPAKNGSHWIDTFIKTVTLQDCLWQMLESEECVKADSELQYIT